ncbi:MAG: sigma-70 family RNA polymerase sigma factor [Desulfobacteraceae bacterium]|jgi:RNA polymerase sigma-70 factor (ECF subfamily)
MNDLDLINRIIDGDRIGFNQLIRKWEKRIYSFVFRYLGNREAALDVTQKTFLNTYRNIAKLRDPSRFSSWIYQIASNLCRDEIGRMKKREIVPLDDIQESNEKRGKRLPVQFMESIKKQPDARLENKQLAAIVKVALQELPEEQRMVVIMKEYQGLRFTEIADALNEPVSTIKSRMYRSLISLREIFEKQQITKEVLNDEV